MMKIKGIVGRGYDCDPAVSLWAVAHGDTGVTRVFFFHTKPEMLNPASRVRHDKALLSCHAGLDPASPL
jgi:hypothetical protein